MPEETWGPKHSCIVISAAATNFYSCLSYNWINGVSVVKSRMVSLSVVFMIGDYEVLQETAGKVLGFKITNDVWIYACCFTCALIF